MKNVELENKPLLMKAFKAVTWLMRFAHVNVLWIIFTIGGLVVFSGGPATLALTKIIVKWHRGEEDFSLLTVYIDTFKTDYLKSTALFIMLLILGTVSVFNLYFSISLGLPIIIISLAIIAVIIYLLIFVSTYMVSVHYDLKQLSFYSLFKKSMLLIVLNPPDSLIVLLSVVSILLINLRFPGLILFFSTSTVMYVTSLRMADKALEYKKIQF